MRAFLLVWLTCCVCHASPRPFDDTLGCTCVGSVQRVGQSYGIDLICPPASLCTDNAAMIAWAAIEYAISDQHDLNGMVSSEAGALDDGPYGVQIRSRWPLGVDYREWPAEHGQDIADEVHSR